MKKVLQQNINAVCLREFNKAFDEAIDDAKVVRKTKKRLRNCTAWVYETENYFLLKSFSTYIACIDKHDRVLYDVLRYEYEYTNTSAMHISKLCNDYNVTNRLTYRKV